VKIVTVLVGAKTTSSQSNSTFCTAPIQRISMRRQAGCATDVVSAVTELTMSQIPDLADRAANRRLLDRRQWQHFVFRNPVVMAQQRAESSEQTLAPTTKPDHTPSFGRAIEFRHG
jgi:hypothetical protein